MLQLSDFERVLIDRIESICSTRARSSFLMQGAVVWRDSPIVHAAPVHAEDLGRPRSSRRPIAGAAQPSAERGVSSTSRLTNKTLAMPIADGVLVDAQERGQFTDCVAAMQFDPIWVWSLRRHRVGSTLGRHQPANRFDSH
jgi:hypothetical protein